VGATRALVANQKSKIKNQKSKIPRGGFAGRGHYGREFKGFLKQWIDMRLRQQFGTDNEFQPVGGFIGFLVYDCEFGDEVLLGTAAAGSAIVGTYGHGASDQLIANGTGCRRIRNLIDQLEHAQSKVFRTQFEIGFCHSPSFKPQGNYFWNRSTNPKFKIRPASCGHRVDTKRCAHRESKIKNSSVELRLCCRAKIGVRRESKIKNQKSKIQMFCPEELKSNRPLKWSPGQGTDVWAMICAAMTGDVAALERLLARDPSLARCHYRYRKPIYFAVRENRLDAAGLLMERDSDPIGLAVNDTLVEIATDRGYMEMQQLLKASLDRIHRVSPRAEEVAAAIRSGNLSAVEALLEVSPELVHVADLHGNQPIHWAVMTRQPAIIDVLLRRGADINAQRPDGARPIQLTNGDYNHRGWRDVPQDHPFTPRMVLDHLRARGANCDLCTACHIGDVARVRELLEENPALANRPSEYLTYYPCSGTPLRNAAAAGHLEIVRQLLDSGADPNLPEEHIAPQGHALYSAATNGHYEVAKLLLERGAYPNAEVESSADTLSRVLANGDKRMLELLCSYGAARPVHLLAHDNDLETAAAVFAANPGRANDPDALGSARSAEFIGLMLRYCPDLARRASLVKNRELTELLFAHGMDPSAPDWLGFTPLHQIAQRGNLEAAALFLDHGANLHARDEDICSTPLGWAAKFGRKEMVEFLLSRGAQANLPDDPPWATPLAWAQRRGHTNVVEVLRQSGAR